MDWDDYKYFSVLVESGSVRAAAKQLGVNASTVSRRLEQFEARLGVRLFQRTQAGLQLTMDGQEVVEQVARVAQTLGEVEGHLRGRDQNFSTPLRVLLPDFLATGAVMEELAAFQIDHPEVRLSLLAQSSGLQVSRREVDVALISTDSPPLDMIGHELGRVNWALYRRIGLEGVDAWVGAEPDSDFAADGGGVHDAMRLRFAPTANVVHTASNLQLCFASVRVGLGVSALPCVVADGATNVERVPGTTLQDGPALWILVHPDLRNAARVQRFSERIREVFARRVELL